MRTDKRLSAAVWWAWQWLWGLPQNLAGAVICLCLHGTRERYRGSVVTYWKLPACMSMGCFLFMGSRSRRLLVHEYGHTVQSAIFGPLYLPLMALPSMLWFLLPPLRRLRRKRRWSYYRFYTEALANYLGERVTGEPSMGYAIID